MGATQLLVEQSPRRLRRPKHVVIKVKGLNRSPPGDITGVGIAVGYDSPSQFTREYRRMFGETPSRDALALRGPIDINEPRHGELQRRSLPSP